MSEIRMTLRPNVILITVDSLRRDHLSCYGYPIRTSPVIDKLATNGVRFSEAFANGGGTPESFPSLLFGSLPPFNWNKYGTVALDGLPKFFKDRGYTTAAFHSNAYISKYYGYDHFFDTFEDNMVGPGDSNRKTGKVSTLFRSLTLSLFSKLPLSAELPLFDSVGGKKIISGLTEYHGKKDATQITDQAISWLSLQRGNYFLWIHYMDVHIPYLPPVDKYPLRKDRKISVRKVVQTYRKVLQGYEKLSSDDTLDLIALYDCCINYVDFEVGRLLKFVEKDPRENIVIFTSDHGDAFGEHGRFNHEDVHDEIIHIPMIVSSTKYSVGQVDNRLFCSMQLLDLIKNLDEGNHIQNRKTITDVISVSLDRFRKTRSISLRTEHWKYIRNENIGDDGVGMITGQELFCLDSDPHEKNNLLFKHEDMVSEFEKKINLALNSSEHELVSTEKSPMSLEDEELVRGRLEKLGYL